MKAPYDAVVFDLGGVLADFGGVGPMRQLTGIESDDEVWRRWLTCRWVRDFEAGRCSADDFAAGVVDDWGLAISPAAFLAGFQGWLAGPLPGAEALVRQVREVSPVGCLSNTNRLHWEEAGSRWSLSALFDYRFLSFELGQVKPDPAIFQLVAEVSGIALERMLFLDDNQINVDGARAVGMVAERVRGVDEARAALVASGVLAPG